MRLQRGAAGWEVLLDGALFSTNQELDWGALDALVLAGAHGTTIELGAEVPTDALDRGRVLYGKWKPTP